MKRFFLSPLFSPIATVVLLITMMACAYLVRACIGVYDADKCIVIESGTYVCYALSFVTLFRVAKDHLKTSRQGTFWAVTILWCTVLLREMGAQHWLTSHDTTAIKIRFFTNPANPLPEKIVVASILLILIAIVLYLIIKHVRQMVVGFFKLETLYWTIATFGGVGVATQVADRFPSRYAKMTSVRLEEPILFCSKLFEECGELLLPLLFVVAFWQFHLLLAESQESTCE